MKGLANIPIIIALALIIGITPFAINQVQKSQILQNKAAPIVESSVPCTELILANKQFCTGEYNYTVPTSIPCSDIQSALTQYCAAVYQPGPTIISQPTNKPQPTSIPKPTIRTQPTIKPQPTIGKIGTTVAPVTCQTGQTKCVGRIIFTCKANQWSYTQVCPSACQNGKCTSGNQLY